MLRIQIDKQIEKFHLKLETFLNLIMFSISIFMGLIKKKEYKVLVIFLFIELKETGYWLGS